MKVLTDKQVDKLKAMYESNKEQLQELEQYIKVNGITDDGVIDATNSFEQGFNNALEQVFNMLGIKPLTVEELKLHEDYEFECNMSDEYKNRVHCDEWGCASIFYGDVGVEYNFCIDGEINCCAIYKMETNEESDYMETDYNTYIHYEIDFDNENWEQELENAMCKALIEFYNL